MLGISVQLLLFYGVYGIFHTKVPILSRFPPYRQQVRIQILDTEEPVDVLEILRHRYNQTSGWREQVIAQLCDRVACRRRRPIVYSLQVKGLGTIKLMEDDAVPEVVLSFCRQKALRREDCGDLIEAVCRKTKHVQVRCRPKPKLSEDIYGPNGLIGKLEIAETEPIDSIYRFMVDHDLDLEVMAQLSTRICARVRCHRDFPLIYDQNISLGQRLLRLQIPFDTLPADAIALFAAEHLFTPEQQAELLQAVCKDRYVQCEREVFMETEIVTEDGQSLGSLQILKREELADAVYRFGTAHNVTRSTRNSLFETLCGQNDIRCTRREALLHSIPVRFATDKLGSLRLYEDQEPADAVFDFAIAHQLSPSTRDTLLDRLCLNLPVICSRYAPIAISIPIAADNETQLGILDILQDEEAADAIARFGNRLGLTSQVKFQLVQSVCTSVNVRCTRSIGILYQTQFTFPNGSKELVSFYDGQEPVDIVLEYALLRNLTVEQRKELFFTSCNEPRKRLNCTRAEAMLFQLPIWESSDKKLADFELLEGQEPIDVVYAFLEKHDLFQTAPLNTSLIEIVCNSSRARCERTTPFRLLFTMQATYRGIPHTIPYVQPSSEWHCEKHQGGQHCVHHAEILATQYCALHMTEWSECAPRVLEALRTHLEAYEAQIWQSKNLYAKLGLVRSASKEEIDAAYNTLVMRYNNETEPQKYVKLREAYTVLSDPEEKYYYDLPCVKLFGCLCGKKKKDGSILFVPD
uniref:Uncharacterized protein AlNc14C2G225 n=1 Tax=Albugo laibachii Nc14 TaxID=890382 RepID=F0VZP2_9STRA|nr:conserved hypothetical protein [Albugo laibachii Nc14]|eukprot:CCA14114.1 conserved hypothetical protein [Albugo laibachii Nc14]